MESLPKDSILEFNSNTLQYLRKQYELDKRERLEDAINILQNWLSKQEHMIKKDYSREYLERTIIISKGSVERAKLKLDKIATCRTLLPQFFEPIEDVNKIPIFDDVLNALLPKLTKDQYRVYFIKYSPNEINPGLFDYYKYLVMICEYIQSHDYCNGVIAVYDYTDANILSIVKSVNLVELQQVLRIIMEGFGMRIKGIHFITTSTTINVFIRILKQVLSPKVGDRIHVHQSYEGLYSHIDKEILPSNYGGQGKTLSELNNDFNGAICSKEFLSYLEEMKAACTNENYRRDDKFNEEYLGMPGSFRKLSVD